MTNPFGREEQAKVRLRPDQAACFARPVLAEGRGRRVKLGETLVGFDEIGQSPLRSRHVLLSVCTEKEGTKVAGPSVRPKES